MNIWQPADYATFEIFFMKLGFAYVLYGVFSSNIAFGSQPRPVGIARAVNLTYFSQPQVNTLMIAAGYLCLLLYLTNIGALVVLPVLFAVLFVLEVLRSSQGAATHSKHVLGLALLAQLILYWAFFLFPDGWWADMGSPDQVALFVTQQAVVALYFTSAITKLRRSGFSWVKNAPYIKLDIIKSSEQKYYDALDESWLAKQKTLDRGIFRYPNIIRLVLASGLLIELLSPLFLINRVTLLLGGGLLLLFHNMVGSQMGIHFKKLQWMVLIFFINPPYWLMVLLETVSGNFRG